MTYIRIMKDGTKREYYSLEESRKRTQNFIYKKADDMRLEINKDNILKKGKIKFKQLQYV